MGLFNKLREPVFLKESSSAELQLKQLKEIEPFLNKEGKAIINQDIRCLEYGIEGEKNIAFELKNSHMPIYVLHDIYLESGDLNAQIDYLIITKKICFVVECKNLYGDIEINSEGDFIRTMEIGGKKKKEGIYSPITQNQRHLELMKKIAMDKKNNIVTKFMTDRYFTDFNKTLVVLANPKTILNAKSAKKEIKEKVIRADQLVRYIKDTYNDSKEQVISDEKMYEWAMKYMERHKDVQKDYSQKYQKYMINEDDSCDIREADNNIEKLEVYVQLKAYRLSKSREEQIRPYYIFNNEQLNELVKTAPKNSNELLQVSGFGAAKVKKYGNDIIRIIQEYL